MPKAGPRFPVFSLLNLSNLSNLSPSSPAREQRRSIVGLCVVCGYRQQRFFFCFLSDGQDRRIIDQWFTGRELLLSCRFRIWSLTVFPTCPSITFIFTPFLFSSTTVLMAESSASGLRMPSTHFSHEVFMTSSPFMAVWLNNLVAIFDDCPDNHEYILNRALRSSFITLSRM